MILDLCAVWKCESRLILHISSFLQSKKNKRHRRGTGELNKHMSPLNSPDVDETHIIVKNNAMFLLELASAAGVNIPKQQRRPSQTLTSVAENYSPPEAAGPFPSTGPFQCLLSLGVQNSQSNDEMLYEESLRRQGQQNSYEGSNNGFTVSNKRVGFDIFFIGVVCMSVRFHSFI